MGNMVCVLLWVMQGIYHPPSYGHLFYILRTPETLNRKPSSRPKSCYSRLPLRHCPTVFARLDLKTCNLLPNLNPNPRPTPPPPKKKKEKKTLNPLVLTRQTPWNEHDKIHLFDLAETMSTGC